MNASTLILITFAVLPILAIAANWLLLRGKIHWFLLFFLCCLAGYGLWVSVAAVADVELKRELDSFDLDGDGSWSQEEMTPEAQEAMQKWTSDTGRTLAPFVGIPVSLFWNTVNFGVIGIATFIVRTVLKQLDRRSNNLPPETASPTSDSTNPYLPPTKATQAPDGDS